MASLSSPLTNSSSTPETMLPELLLSSVSLISPSVTVKPGFPCTLHTTSRTFHQSLDRGGCTAENVPPPSLPFPAVQYPWTQVLHQHTVPTPEPVRRAGKATQVQSFHSQHRTVPATIVKSITNPSTPMGLIMQYVSVSMVAVPSFEDLSSISFQNLRMVIIKIFTAKIFLKLSFNRCCLV